jgi:hypothetical protein
MESLAKEHLDIPDDYDSDEAASEHESPVYAQGLHSCKELFKNALENRVASKRRVKNHSSEAAAPGTNDHRQR